VHFQLLRLSGFKSFVDPTEFRIEPGLTGIVGPNGCGKSNILESLRWVMGANSAKAMRGDGMDDVIFAGSGGRPSRNHAEVSLTIDNTDRTAPAAFNADSVVEVVRRIDRGQGSTYRINGREVRARDVQLLFADASTGANSPALVRQGQISELIAAKPQNRRRILEEAGGVSGLHTRRHEAELRLRGAETNVARLDDISRELDTTLGRLRREARQAERYKLLSAEIRTLQSAALYARWTQARDGLTAAEAEHVTALQAVELTAREAAAASTTALGADEAIKPLRDEEAISAAVLQRLVIEKDRVDGEAARAAAEIARIETELARISDAREREAHMIDDAKSALDRLTAELVEVEALAAAEPSRIPELEKLFRAADAARTTAEAELERLAAQVAADEARRRAAAARIQEARERLSRTVRALDQAKADRAGLGPETDPAAADAAAKLALAEAALVEARASLEAAEAERAAASVAEAAARDAARKAEDQLGRLKTEARGLAQLTVQQRKGGFAPALDAVSPQKGYEAALTAALGDDLDAALDSKAAAYWGGRDASAPAWPKGATPLGPLIAAPPELAARLAFTALVARADGDRLAKDLAPGSRLVSREGDLWRWDGFVARADAPKPAAVRLEQRARLSEAEAEIDRLSPTAAAATKAQADAAARIQALDAALRDARRLAQEAERALAPLRDALEYFGREFARREARAQSLDETIARFDAERGEAETTLALAIQEGEDPTGGADLSPMLTAAREKAAEAREAAAHARADLEHETRSRQTRLHRLESVRRDRADWLKRSESAAKRIEQLARDDADARLGLLAARDAPAIIDKRRAALLDDLAIAEARRAKSADALDQGEAAKGEADRAARAADAAASAAREHRAAVTARLDAARERLLEIAARVRETARVEPEALGDILAAEAHSRSGGPVSADPDAIDQRLYQLERDRDAIGPVNLRAEEEAAELAARVSTMKEERADLTAAIAKLREGIDALNAEGRERLLTAFDIINGHFQTLFGTLFGGGQAELRLVENDDPLEAGLEIYACPPGKRLSTMSLMSGGEQALTAAALIFGVFLANPAPVCVLDEVDAPLDDANVERFCNMLDEMRTRTGTRFIAITHNAVTMSRMDRLYGVTMPERGVSQLVSVDLRQAEAMVA
jgi:chromosome segregation protein